MRGLNKSKSAWNVTKQGRNMRKLMAIFRRMWTSTISSHSVQGDQTQQATHVQSAKPKTEAGAEANQDTSLKKHDVIIRGLIDDPEYMIRWIDIRRIRYNELHGTYITDELLRQELSIWCTAFKFWDDNPQLEELLC